MENLYTYFRWLSLDIVTGAIFFLAYLGFFYQVTFSFATYFALSSAIWIIYTTDHLIDARKVRDPSSDRHRFHKRNYRLLVVIGGVVLMSGLINLYFLPTPIIRNGAILTAVCVGYLLIVYVNKKVWIKEVIVATAYATGIFLAPLTLTGQIQWLDYLLFVQVVLIAFINLLIFSYYEMEKDQQDGFGSLVIRLGKLKSGWLIHALCLISVTLSGVAFILYGLNIQGLLFLMSSILYGLFLMPQLVNGDRFRIIGDGIFYLPALFLL